MNYHPPAESSDNQKVPEDPPSSSSEPLPPKPSQEISNIIDVNKPEPADDDDDDDLEAHLKKKYSKISNEKRLELIDSVENQGQNIKQVAKRLDINYSSAKSIYQVFKKEGRTNKKVFKTRYMKEEAKGANNMVNPEFPEAQKVNDAILSGQGSKSGSNLQTVSQKDSLGDIRDRLLEKSQTSGGSELSKEGSQGNSGGSTSQVGNTSTRQYNQTYNCNNQQHQDVQYNERLHLQKQHIEEQQTLNRQHQEQQQNLFDQQRVQQQQQHLRHQDQQQHLYSQQKNQQQQHQFQQQQQHQQQQHQLQLQQQQQNQFQQQQQQQQQFYQQNQSQPSYYLVSSQPSNQVFYSYVPQQNQNQNNGGDYNQGQNSGRQNSKNSSVQNFYISENTTTYYPNQNPYPQHSSGYYASGNPNEGPNGNNQQQQNQYQQGNQQGQQMQMQPLMFMPGQGQPSYIMHNYPGNSNYPPQQGGYYVVGPSPNQQGSNEGQRNQNNNEAGKINYGKE